MAEIARHQTGVKPRHESVDAEHREAQPPGERRGIGHHVGAFEQDRSDFAMIRDQSISGSQDVALRRGDVEPLFVIDHDAAELAAVIGAGDRGRRIGASGQQVLFGEISGADCENPGTTAGRQDALDKRDLHQARGRNRHADMCRYLALVERQKPASRRNAVGAQAHKLFRSVEELVVQPRCLVADDATRRGARHNLVKNWKRPCLGIAMSPGIRGNRVSSIKMPTLAP